MIDDNGVMWVKMEFVEELEQYLKQKDDIIKLLTESNDFYADIDNQPVIDDEYNLTEKHSGKKARETKKKIQEILKGGSDE